MHPIRTRLAVPAAIAAAAALAFAGTAHAQPNNGGTQAKKGCVIRFEGPGAGQSLEYPDGSSLSVQGTDGKKHTYTCNDGKWTETVAIVAQPGSAISSGTFQIVAGLAHFYPAPAPPIAYTSFG